MFRIWLRIAGLLAAFPLALGGSASAAVSERGAAEAAWAKASQHNTLEAYAEFVIAHPGSKYAQRAYARLSTVGTVELNSHGVPVTDDSADPGFSESPFIPNSIMV